MATPQKVGARAKRPNRSLRYEANRQNRQTLKKDRETDTVVDDKLTDWMLRAVVKLTPP